MTKVRILGQEPEEKKDLKPIVFVKEIYERGEWDKNCSFKPDGWKNIDLICFNWRGSEMDLMLAYDDNPSNNGVIVLGHFNDGVV